MIGMRIKGHAGRWLMLAGAALAGVALADGPAEKPLPADLNAASMRVSALATMYELDLSGEQLKALRAAAGGGVASTRKRTAAKANAGLAAALKAYQAALLEGHDDDAITKARDKVVEANGEVDLDDDVEPTGAALAAAPGFGKRLKASQVAAFLAIHADDVADPVEMVLGAAEAIRELQDEKGNEGEIADLTRETAATAGYLVGGADAARVKAVGDGISAWLKKVGKAAGAGDEAAVKTIVGEVDPIVVVGNWMNFRLATLLANPELPAAIDALAAARGK